jgi:Fe-S cluster assembly protein SufD
MSLATTNYLALTGREEAWRFTPLNRLAGLHDASIALNDRISLEAQALPAGVKVDRVAATEAPGYGSSDDRINVRVRESVSQVLVVTIQENAEIADPIRLNRQVIGMLPESSRVLIHALPNSHATVVIENSGDCVLAEEIEIKLEPGSNIRFVTLQEWSSATVHVATHHAILEKDSTFTSFVITIGGSVVRF